MGWYGGNTSQLRALGDGDPVRFLELLRSPMFWSIVMLAVLGGALAWEISQLPDELGPLTQPTHNCLEHPECGQLPEGD